MIVQCEQCKTKYRIADDKVKDKGVKVRCAKCDNVFTVTPPEKDTQDGPTVFKPSTPVPPDPPSDVGAASDENHGLEPPDSRPGEDTEPDGLTGPSTPDSSPSAEGREDLPMPGEGAGQFGSESPSDPAPGSYLPPAPEEGSLKYGSTRPEHEMDQSLTGEAAPPADSPPVSEDTDFEIEGTMREETSSGPDPFSDGMGSLAKPAQPVDGEWGNISIDAPTGTDPSEGVFGLAESPDYEPEPPMEDTLDQELSDPVSAPSQSKDGTTIVTSRPAPAKSGGGKKGLLLVLLLAVLGAGGYFAYPTVMNIIQSKTQQPAGTLTAADIHNIQVKALNRSDGRLIYSVRGEIRNESGGSVGMVKVEAQFRDASGKVLARAVSYCGNILEDGALVGGDLNQIKKDLQNELGQSLSNSNIPPGKTIPFLVVLDNPPEGVSKVTVTVSSFKKTT